MNKKKIWIAVVSLILMLGCQEKEYRIKVRYNRISNLEKGSPVLEKGKPIGHVSSIERDGKQKYKVTMSIDSERKNLVTEYASFAIVQLPDDEDRNAVDIRVIREGGDVLPNGSVVDGMDPELPSLLEMVKKEMAREISRFQENFSDLSKDWDDFRQALREIPDKQAVKELKKELEKLGREMKESNQEWKEKIQKELLPALRKELDRLEEKLQRKGQEKDMAPLEVRMEKL